MNKADLDYYRSRKTAEEAAAQRAGHPCAVKSHQRLAEHYAGLIKVGEAEIQETAPRLQETPPTA